MKFSSLTAASRRLGLGAGALLAAGALAVPAVAPAAPIPPDLCPACAEHAPVLTDVVVLNPNTPIGAVLKPKPYVDPGPIAPQAPADPAPASQGNAGPGDQGAPAPAPQDAPAPAPQGKPVKHRNRDDNERGDDRGDDRGGNDRFDDRGGDD